MHSKSDNIKFTSYNDADKVFVTSFKISRQFRKINERTCIYFWFTSTDVVTDVDYKVNSRRGGLYINSPDWIKEKKG